MVFFLFSITYIGSIFTNHWKAKKGDFINYRTCCRIDWSGRLDATK